MTTCVEALLPLVGDSRLGIIGGLAYQETPMIICPTCLHQNPDATAQCKACYSPLPATSHCPNCGLSVQADAGFCGQCGFNLGQTKVARAGANPVPAEPETDILAAAASPAPAKDFQPEPQVAQAPQQAYTGVDSTFVGGPRTELQQQAGCLLHVQSNTAIELPQALTVIHIGKPNDRVPPDVDIAGFPNSEVVSRVHANIRVEGGTYFIEDAGSANGTYINHTFLPPGNRHRLRHGDRVALGKGDLVSFLFQQN